MGHKNSYALEIFMQLLSTHTGRLYKSLVVSNGIASDIGAAQYSMKLSGFFDMSGEVATGYTPEEVEKALHTEVEKLQRDDVPPNELQNVKNNFADAQYRKLSSDMSILHQLIWNEDEGDWCEINDADTNLQAVSTTGVKRVANEYFQTENRAVATFTRKAAAAKTTSK